MDNEQQMKRLTACGIELTEPVKLTPADLAYVECRKFDVNEIARAYSVDPKDLSQ